MGLAIRFLLPVFACLAVPPPAQGTELLYDLYVIGTPVAAAGLTIDLAPSRYRTELHFRTTGLGQVFTGGHLDERVVGQVGHDRLMPQTYDAASVLRGQQRDVRMTWRAGGPTVTEAIPPNEQEREIVPPAMLQHAADPLSTLVDLLLQVSRTGGCDRSARTFDGRRLEIFEARTAGEEIIQPTGRSSYAGRGLRCDFTSRVISGLLTGEARAEDTRIRHGSIWLARVIPDAVWMPVRARFELRFIGDATLYLTSITP